MSMIMKFNIVIAIEILVITCLISYVIGFVHGFRKAKKIDDDILEEMGRKIQSDGNS